MEVNWTNEAIESLRETLFKKKNLHNFQDFPYLSLYFTPSLRQKKVGKLLYLSQVTQKLQKKYS